jgi:hypothetical protein
MSTQTSFSLYNLNFYLIQNNFEKYKAQNNNGFVYLIFLSNSQCKIGMTNNFKQRYKALERTFAYMQAKPTSIYISEEHQGYCINEKLLHDIYSKYRIDGTELFNVNIDFIGKIKSEMILQKEYSQIHQKIYIGNNTRIYVDDNRKYENNNDIIYDINSMVDDLHYSKSFLLGRNLNKYELDYISQSIKIKGIYALLNIKELFE